MRLLIVEDDADGREILVELFRRHAWEVTAVPTTAAALTALRNGRFDVVVSDEDLCGSSGSAMLRDACAEGLLANVGALMYTSEPATLEVPPGVRILHKPLGITALLQEVQASVPEVARNAPPSSSTRTRKRGSPIELVLYVTDSVSSRRALGNMKRVLEELRPSCVDVVVHDLERDPLDEVGAAEQLPFTPVLVKKHPGEEQHFAFDLESAQSLTALIRELEVQASATSPAPQAESPPSSKAR